MDGAISQGPVRCMVVDDHPALRRGLATALAAEDDFEVVGEAGDAETALRMAELRRPEVAVVDIELPGVDGLELTRRVTGCESPPRVVLYTCHDDVGLLDAGLEAGAIGFVLKDGPLADVVRAVRSAAAGRPYVDASLTASLLARRDRDDGTGLSPRETEVLQLLADGLTTEAAGEKLFLSPATVRSYVESAMRKVEGRNRLHAVANALRDRLIS